MAKIMIAKSGHKVIKMKMVEIVEAECGALGICDFCNKADFNGYYIPVLKSWYCEKCFNDWEQRAEFYEEDKPFEDAQLKHMAARLEEKNLLEKE